MLPNPAHCTFLRGIWKTNKQGIGVPVHMQGSTRLLYKEPLRGCRDACTCETLFEEPFRVLACLHNYSEALYQSITGAQRGWNDRIGGELVDQLMKECDCAEINEFHIRSILIVLRSMHFI
eukprot:1156631-Pelagomonas_calceolata.AAC.5